MYNRLTWILMLAVILAPMGTAIAVDVKIMEVDTLKRLLDDPDLVVLDVRTGRDWSSSELKIKGAQRAEPREIDNWSAGLDGNKTVVLYCA